MITAGPTREFLDPVRFLSNPSSGKMGIYIADEAAKMGADVLLIHGPVDVPIPERVRKISITSAEDMYNAVMKNYNWSDCVVMSSAVADFTPTEKIEAKIKKNEDELLVRLKRTKDILAELGKNKGKKILVGFALETENLEENARKKLHNKNLDIIVANLQSDRTGFRSDTNEVLILHRNGTAKKIPLTSKRKIAREILKIIALEVI